MRRDSIHPNKHKRAGFVNLQLIVNNKVVGVRCTISWYKVHRKMVTKNHINVFIYLAEIKNTIAGI